MSDQENIAASGYSAPTTEEAQAELKMIQDLLAGHNCPTTRDLINAASVAVDIAHKDAHSITSDAAQKAVNEAVAKMEPVIIETITTGFKSLEVGNDRVKFLARMVSIFLQLSRTTGYMSIQEAKRVLDTMDPAAVQALIDGENAATPIPTEATVSGTAEDAIKKLLDIPVKSKYKM